jgi:hypothetical protein
MLGGCWVDNGWTSRTRWTNASERLNSSV